MPHKPERAALGLHLQDQLAGLLLTTKGYASPGLVDACDRMRAPCDELDQIGRRAQTLWRLAIIHLYRCDFEQSSSVGHELIRMAGEPGGSGAASLGHFVLGLSANHSGRCG